MRILSGRTRLILLLFYLPCALSGAQVTPAPAQTQQERPAAPGPPTLDGGSESDPMARRLAGQQALQRNAQRHDQIVADTAKLLALAQELKAEVEKSNKNTLSLNVVKKAQEIEKLSKSIKERMRDGS